MGCASSSAGSGVDKSMTYAERPSRVMAERAQGSLQTQMVKEVFDKDVHEVYDFTGPVLGKGGFATVLNVKDRLSGADYAIKQIDTTELAKDPKVAKLLKTEISVMKNMSHPNIVRLQEVYQPPDEAMLYLVLDRLSGGSLFHLWKEQGRLSEDHVAHILVQILSAIRYCHGMDIAHRDLKMDNVLFEDESPEPVVKVIDFGLCAEFKDGFTSRAFVGTQIYCAPEVIKAESHSLPCDMWSFGTIAYCLVGGQYPFYSKDPAMTEQYIKVRAVKFPEEEWKDISPLCKDLISKCLTKDPKRRMTAVQAWQHPWMKAAQKALEGSGARLGKGALLAMKRFQTNNQLKKVAMEMVAYSMEPSDIRELELEFMKMDKTGNGKLSAEEFKQGLLAMRRKSSRAMVDSSQSTSRLSVGALLALEQAQAGKGGGGGGGSGSGSETNLKLDDVSTHYVDASAPIPLGMKRLTSSGSTLSVMSEGTVDRMFEAMDVDQDGCISFTEFVAGCLTKKDLDEAATRTAFERLDYHGKGRINMDDMKMYLGKDMDPEEMETCFRDMGGGDENELTYDQFRRGMVNSISVRNMVRTVSSGRLTSEHGELDGSRSGHWGGRLPGSGSPGTDETSPGKGHPGEEKEAQEAKSDYSDRAKAAYDSAELMGASVGGPLGEVSAMEEEGGFTASFHEEEGVVVAA